MIVKDLISYESLKSTNTDWYFSYVIRYAERWADMMEKAIENGENLTEVADRLSHEADTEYISGRQYGMAVSLLSDHWAYGEQLRQMHNKKYGHEGEGVIDPSVITVVK